MQNQRKAGTVYALSAGIAIRQVLNYLMFYAQPFCKSPETDAARNYVSRCMADIETLLQSHAQKKRKMVCMQDVKKIRRQKKFSSALKIQRVNAHLLDDG